MTELTTLMRDSAERIPTGPPPYAAIRRRAHRRRAAFWGAGVAAAAVLAAAATTVSWPVGSTLSPGPSGHSNEPSGVPVLLDTSAFDVGVDHVRGTDRLAGTLRATHGDRCLVVGDGRTPVFWPHGWGGLTHGSGFSLLDQEGRVVAETGDQVVLHGRLLDPADWGGDDTCTAGARESFMVTGVEVQ